MRGDGLRLAVLVLVVVPMAACSSEPAPRTGSIDMLTYNVAGLPEGISSSHPEVNIPQISPLLNPYDLVVVQEDFWYHEQLVADAGHAYQSEPWSDEPSMLDMGDGLNRFSIWPFGALTRTAWPGCNGALDCASDCLATKGFGMAVHVLDDGVEIHVYNLHMEAGGCPEDAAIREASISLLLETFEERSADAAIIVAGDWNLHEDEEPDRTQLRRMVEEGGFEDACWQLECGETNIDRVFFRSGGGVTLRAVSWAVPEGFVDSEGVDLSDHEPVAVTLEWTAR